MKISFRALVALAFIWLMPFIAHAQDNELDLENTIYLDLKDGRVVIKNDAESGP